MKFDLQRVIESKSAYRRALAKRPVAEKLAMPDQLRDRTLVIRAAAKRWGATARSGAAPEDQTKTP